MRILLYSGGLDSLIAWYYLDRPQRLYVDLNTRYTAKEKLSLRGNSPDPGGVTCRYHTSWGRYEKEDAWIPMRNMLLIMVAAAEGADIIYLVCQRGEQSIPDRSLEFFQDMSQIMTLHNKREILVDPVFPDWDKVTMVRWYLEEGYPAVDLIKAFSCYSTRPPCGQCGACWRKFIALEANGVRCEHSFLSDIRAWGTEHYLPRLHEYGPERRDPMISVMGWEL